MVIPNSFRRLFSYPAVCAMLAISGIAFGGDEIEGGPVSLEKPGRPFQTDTDALAEINAASVYDIYSKECLVSFEPLRPEIIKVKKQKGGYWRMRGRGCG